MRRLAGMRNIVSYFAVLGLVIVNELSKAKQ
jgi:hypothetical protein